MPRNRVSKSGLIQAGVGDSSFPLAPGRSFGRLLAFHASHERRTTTRLLRVEACEERAMMAVDLAGTKFTDLTGNGPSVDDTPLAGVTINLFADTNGNGVYNPGQDLAAQPAQVTDVNGAYTFAGVTDGTYFIVETAPAGSTQTFPAGYYTVEVIGNQAFAGAKLDIDDFELPDPAASYVISLFNPDPTLIKSTVAGVVGGERDVLIDVLGAAGQTTISGTIGLGALGGVFSFGSSFPGVKATLQYDGSDADVVGPPASLINAQGLVNVDLTNSGANTGFRFDFETLQVPGAGTLMDVQIRLASAGGTATFSGNATENMNPQAFFAPFGNFVIGGAFDFANVTSIEIDFNSLGVADIDFVLNNISTTSTPKSRGYDFSNFFSTQPVSGIQIIKFTNGQDANNPTGPIIAVGGTATFTYDVSNTGQLPLFNVTVVDDNGTPGNPNDDFNPTFVGGDTDGDGQLDLTEVWQYTANRVVTAGQYTNIATVTGVDQLQRTVTDDDPSNHFGAISSIQIIKFTNGQDANNPTGPIIAVGGTATFTYDVTNPGNVPLSDVVVVDDNGTPGNPNDDFSPTFVGGDTDGDNQLDVTETWQYTANRVVTAGQYTNIAVVTALDPNRQTVTDDDPSNHFGAIASIQIIKFTNGQDANNPTGPVIQVGGTATFTYDVTNPGNVPLANVVVVDDNGTPGNPNDDFNPTFVGGDTDGDNQLDVTETWQYTANRVVTAGQYANIAVVTALGPNQQTVTDNDPSNHFGAVSGIQIIKFTNGQDANNPTGPFIPVGGTATFTYDVSNTGNQPLSNVVVVDDNGTPGNPNDDFSPTFTGGDTDGDNQLDVTEVWHYTANRVVTAGQYTNIAVVTAVDPFDDTVTDNNPSNHFGLINGIQIIKFTNGDDANNPTGPVIPVGGTATFTYDVSNTGNVALIDVEVIDDNGTPGNPNDDFAPTFTGGDTDGDNELDVNEVWHYTANRVVTAGQYTNIATVTAVDPRDQTVTDNDPSNHFGQLPVSSLSGYVYVDVNNDGFFSPVETPLQNVIVTLTDANDNVLATTVTNIDGFYIFTDLQAGNYKLKETQPVQFIDGKDTIGTPGGTTTNDVFSNIVLPPDFDGVNNNFGELGLAQPSKQYLVYPAIHPENRFDINNDGIINAVDVLQVVNSINAAGQTAYAQARMDVNQDGHVNALDALQLVNQLNASASAQSASAQSSAPVYASAQSSTYGNVAAGLAADQAISQLTTTPAAANSSSMVVAESSAPSGQAPATGSGVIVGIDPIAETVWGEEIHESDDLFSLI